MRKALRALRGPGVSQQTMVFAIGSIVSQLLAAVSQIALAAMLSVAGFGAFAFATSFLQYGALFFEFGLFLPAARMAARSDRAGARTEIGAALALYLPVGVAFSLTVFAASFVVDSVFNVGAGTALLVTSPLALVYPFNFVALQLCQAVERLNVYALTNLASQVFFLLMLLALWASGSASPPLAVLLRAASLGIGSCVLIGLLRPRFHRLRTRWKTFAQGAREYGFQVYVGRVLSIGTYNMDILMLGIFTDAHAVALYALAGSIAAGGGLPVTGLGAALFRRMANQPELEPRWLRAAWGVGAACAALVWLLAPPFLGLAFPAGYGGAAAFVGPLALAQVIRGVTTIYNSFLSAQGAGRPLRNAALVLTASNVTLNFLLIPRYGAAGAAWASVVALLANYAAHVHGYRRYVKGARLARAPAGDDAPVGQILR